MLKNAEKNAEVRSAIRMRQLELNFNANYDLINGLPRQVPVVPVHDTYNPDPNRVDTLDLAGRPTRGNSNMPYLVNASDQSQVFEGKKQYVRPNTINKTIPHNDASPMPKSI